MLAALILAAGESKRMGTPKALLQHEGRTFLERILAASRHPRIGSAIVVLGAHAEQVRGRLAAEPVTWVVNPDWQAGQLSSIHAGLDALTGQALDGVVLFLVDHPFISPGLVATLIERFYETGRPIVLPTFQGQRGHPVIFSQKLFAELRSAPRDVGARGVVWQHACEVLAVRTEEEGVVLNLNDPEALRRALTGG